jgi:hypothetical protein
MKNVQQMAISYLISVLAEDQATSYFSDSNGRVKLEELFREGYKGFDNMSPAELVQCAKDACLTSRCADAVAVIEAELASAERSVIKPPADAAGQSEYFPGADVEEVGSLLMQDVVGDYYRPESCPEWEWVQEQASFSHKDNGRDGIWEFVLNMAKTFKDIPPKLQPVLAEAKQKHLAYLIVHQGT